MNAIYDSTNGGHCPTRKQLELFFDGGCSDEDNIWIAGHVGDCEPCSERIAHLAQKDAAFAGLLAGSRHTNMQPRQSDTDEHCVKGASTLAIYVKKLSTLAAAAIVLISILVLSGCGVVTVLRFFQERSLRALYEPFRESPKPAILIGNAAVFLKEAPDTPTRSFIGVDDAAAAGRVFGLLKDMRPKGARLDLLTSAEFEAGPEGLSTSRPVIIIGGPAVSHLAGQTMASVKEPLVFVAHADSASTNAFVRPAAKGEGLGLRCTSGKFFPHKPDTGVTCAVIVRATVNKQHRIVVAGYDARATRLATEAIVKPTKVVDELQEQFLKTGRCILVLSFDSTDRPEIHRIEDTADATGP